MATAGARLRRLVAAAAPMLRIPCALPDLPTPPPPAPVLEAPALALPARGAAMDLMAVPKKKYILLYKKGTRNGPKALKPIPVIVRCRCCGRVKLPHFYCCSGERGNPDSSSS
ncbi:hypothetical protein PVAP13_9KG177300 [Panicum virgatum]|uniref:Large ribosomal subunit protein bL32m n=1 Tax=Panicum virgatum TaxID=38727 RepID=A0A8T0NM69_PANVG|nr:hypothetical protein PVAP13_9KG177300 [Panicum virgatum]